MRRPLKPPGEEPDLPELPPRRRIGLARYGITRAGRIRKQPPIPPPTIYAHHHINILLVERLTNLTDARELRWFFKLKVEGDCDSDAFVTYRDAAGVHYSECWHAAVQDKSTLMRWIREGRAANTAAGIPDDTNESLFALLRMFVTRAHVVEVNDFFVLPAE